MRCSAIKFMRRALRKISLAKCCTRGSSASIIRAPANGNVSRLRCPRILIKLSGLSACEYQCCNAAYSHRFATLPLWHHRAGKHRLDNFAALVGSHITQANNPEARPRTRRPQIDNLRFYSEHVPRSHHIGPAQLIHSETDRAFGEIQSLHKQPHGHRRGVPAARNQTFENCSLSFLAAEMEHLRVKLVGELNELFLRHAKRLRFEAIAHFQVVEVMLFHCGEGETTFMRHRSGLSNP